MMPGKLCCALRTWASVLTIQNSTPLMSLPTIRFTALEPPPPTPMTCAGNVCRVQSQMRDFNNTGGKQAFAPVSKHAVKGGLMRFSWEHIYTNVMPTLPRE